MQTIIGPYLYVQTTSREFRQPTERVWRVKPVFCHTSPRIRTILFVDDYANTVKLIEVSVRMNWTKKGIHIDCVDPKKNIPNQVLNLVAKSNYDLIVMDGTMHGDESAGANLTRQLRSQGFTGIIVANSSSSNKEILEAGASFANLGMKFEFKYLEEVTSEPKSQSSL